MMIGFVGIWMLFVGLITIGVVVLIVYAIIHTANRSGKFDSSSSHEEKRESSNRALEILAERYARGEINDEEYKLKKASLKNSN